MRKFLVIMLLFAGACQSTPAPDPDNGVSNASYRLCISKTESNVADIVSKMQTLKGYDLVGSKQHSSDWWDAQIGVMVDTRDLCHKTLQGSK